MKKLGLLLCALVISAGLVTPAQAQETLTISGKVTLPAGLKAQDLKITAGVYSTSTNADGEFQVFVPKGVDVNFGIRGGFYSDERAPLDTFVTNAGWSTKIRFDSSGEFNFAIPEPKLLVMTFFDASNNALQNVSIFEVNGNQATSFIESGRKWSGIQRLGPLDPLRQMMGVTRTGSISAWIFPIDKSDVLNKHQGFFFRGLQIRGQGVDTPSEETATIDVSQNQNLKLCVPFNFGPSLVMPADCYKTAKQEREELRNARTAPSPGAQKFKNCTALQKVFPGGVAKSTNSKNKGAKLRQVPTVDGAVYQLNKGLDRDKDGLACER